MIRTFKLSAVLFLIFVFAPNLLYSQELHRSEINEIRHAYQVIARSFEQHHPEWSRDLFANNFVETREGSSISRDADAFMSELRVESEQALPPVRVRLKLTRFTRDGEGVKVHVDETTSYRVRAHGSIHTIEYRQRSQDRWVKEAGRWKCVKEADERAPYSTKIDSKPVSFEEFTNLLR